MTKPLANGGVLESLAVKRKGQLHISWLAVHGLKMRQRHVNQPGIDRLDPREIETSVFK